ncbi:MAG: 4-hydroxy-3-methylbut-2-enyl diphosphate reductase [Candidatus Lernaella stagnicola]|nr:4-hydroxy-3-methylbut-2-enyl diphosphate reductase [Candidatus Lernaella stagnicola]
MSKPAAKPRRKFILAENAGFCFGVRRAVDMVLSESASKHGTIATYGPLVHNPQVIELLTLRDIACAENLDELQEGMAVIRSHGVPPGDVDVLRERGLEILNATCPKVQAVQTVIEREAAKGRTVVIFGEKEHPEVIGLMGAARDGDCHVVFSLEEFDALQLPPSKPITLVAQTTSNRRAYYELVEHLEAKHTDLNVRHTICNATERRQQDIRELAETVQAIIVIGGKNSGNTRRLAMIGEELGLPTWHIETADELEGIDFSPYDTVGVTAGASTPSWIIDRVMTRLQEMEEAESQPLLARARRVIEALAAAHVTTGLAAGALAYVGAMLMGVSFRVDFFLLVACYVLSMHVLNRFTETGVDKFRDDPKRQAFYRRFNLILWVLGIGSGLAAIVLGFKLGVVPFWIVLAASIIGMLYSVRVVPRSWMGFLGFRRLKDIAASKNFFVASAWALVSIFPLFFVDQSGSWHRVVLSFLFLFLVTGLRSVILDLSDMASDRLVGRETIPLVLGPARTYTLIRYVLVGLVVSLYGLAAAGWLPGLAWILGHWILVEFLYFEFFRRPVQLPTLTRDMVVDMHFIVAGIVAFIWRSLV